MKMEKALVLMTPFQSVCEVFLNLLLKPAIFINQLRFEAKRFDEGSCTKMFMVKLSVLNVQKSW